MVLCSLGIESVYETVSYVPWINMIEKGSVLYSFLRHSRSLIYYNIIMFRCCHFFFFCFLFIFFCRFLCFAFKMRVHGEVVFEKMVFQFSGVVTGEGNIFRGKHCDPCNCKWISFERQRSWISKYNRLISRQGTDGFILSHCVIRKLFSHQISAVSSFWSGKYRNDFSWK